MTLRKNLLKVNEQVAKFIGIYLLVTISLVTLCQWVLNIVTQNDPSLQSLISYNGFLFTAVSTIVVAVLLSKLQSKLHQSNRNEFKSPQFQPSKIYGDTYATYYESKQQTLADINQVARNIANNLPAFNFRVDEEGTFLEMEGKGLAKLDLQDNELVGENIFDHYPDIADYIRDGLNGHTTNFIGTGYKNGQPWWFKNYVFPDRYRGKGLIGFAIDISEVKLAEKEMSQSKELYEKVLHNLPKTGILLFDSQYRLHMVEGNTFLTELTHLQANDIKGKTIDALPLDHLYDPVSIHKIQQYFDIALQGEAKNLEDVFAGKHYAIHITSLKEYDHQVDYGIIVMQDITNIKDVEARLLKAYLEGQDWERQRIAEKIQEGPSQELYGAQLQLQSLAKDVQEMSFSKRASFEVVNNTLEKATQEVRKISHNLMPDVLIDFGFTTALHSLIHKYRKDQKCQLTFSSNVHSLDLPKDVEVGTYQVIKELLSHSVEHFNAKFVQISLARYRDKLEMTIKDDGHFGENYSTLDGSMELNKVQARVKALKGLFELQENQQKGLTAIIEIPIEESYDKDKSFTG